MEHVTAAHVSCDDTQHEVSVAYTALLHPGKQALAKLLTCILFDLFAACISLELYYLYVEPLALICTVILMLACSTADAWDMLFIFFGLVGAVGSGILMPLFSVVFSRFTNAFGDPYGVDFMEIVKDIALQFTYLAIAGA